MDKKSNHESILWRRGIDSMYHDNSKLIQTVSSNRVRLGKDVSKFILLKLF